MASGISTPLTVPREPRVARTLLVALAVALPFETPLFRLGPLQVTTVELILYATLGAWALHCARAALARPAMLRAAGVALWRHPMGRAALLWEVALLASAVAAPADRASAIKFALRASSGVLVFFACRGLVARADVGRRVLSALVLGALLSAMTAIADWFSPSSASLWSPFREGAFDTFGLDRASGVFAYPTMGAMYWEAAVPLVLAASALSRGCRIDRGPKGDAFVAVILCTLLMTAMLASATRSAFVGAFLACLALWLGTSVERRVRIGAAAVLGVLVLAAGLAYAATGSTSLLGQRLRWWRDERWFGATCDVAQAPRTVTVGEIFRVPVALHNTGTLTWRRDGERPVHLASHWDPIGRPSTHADFEGARTDLPADVSPGGEARLLATVRGPSAPGSYVLRWDLVQEHITWFSERGNVMPAQPVLVEGDPEPVSTAGPVELVVPPPPPPPKRSRLWRAAAVLWKQHPLLGVGPDDFRHRYQAILSPAPGGQMYSDTRLHANSLYFETLADMGLVGVAALAALAVALLLQLRSHFRTGSLTGIVCGLGAATFFVHGVLDYFFEFTPLFSLFWLLMGLASATERPEPSEGRPGNQARGRAR